ncbi:MAG: 30S ribosomal protein S6 [Acetobacteraceae bacterium]|nr:30S ribosomal protein S6 [Acetobacteraceae bacterium]
MPYYECVFIARSDVTPQQVEALAEQMAEVIAQGGGRVSKREYWGLRTLAYKIKKNRKGHYMLLNIDAPWPAVAEMERQLRLNEDVLRFLTVRVESLDEGPSAAIARPSREDRADRLDRPARSADRAPRAPRGERGLLAEMVE